MSFENLPLECIALIMSYATPWDVCRFAAVSRAFAAAARSDSLWVNFLPSDYASIYPKAGLECKRKVAQALAKGVAVDGGKQLYIMLRRSGGICRVLSASGMTISWGDDARFWRWEFARSSCFDKVAHLLAVCWLEISGMWRCSLPPGLYSVVWRLKVANPQGGRFFFLSWENPLRFSVTTSDGQKLEKELDIGHIPQGWFDFEVGQVKVHGKSKAVQELNMTFSMREVDCSFWKGGLYVDCLSMLPVQAINESVLRKPEIQWNRARGRPGVF